MAAGMQRVTVKELIELLKDKEDDEIIGYLFTARESYHSSEHQVLVFFDSITKL